MKHPLSVKRSASLEKSVAALIAAGASEISDQVGIKIAPLSSRWILLPDKTCVWLASRDGNSITLIEAGESGKGYGGKARWQDQEKTSLSEIKILKPGGFQLIKQTESADTN
jgi:hypothetical protein